MKTRSKTLPNIFIAQRTRTLSEQSEEKDEVIHFYQNLCQICRH